MINIGLIGTGGRGVSLAQQINKLNKGRISALADINPVRLKEAATDLNVSSEYTFDNYEELLELDNLEGVIIATPDNVHYKPALAAVKKGKHVYCEKGMATTVNDCTEIVKAAEKSEKIFYVGHNVRFMKTSRKLHELIETGELGKVHMVWARRFVEGAKYWHRWHRYKEKSGGLLVHKGSHYLDQLNWNSQSRPRRVTAFGELSVYQGEEDAPRRCKECDQKADCPYSWNIEEGKARRYYLNAEKEDGYIWDTCVYYPGSDVFDNATVMVQYDNGVKGTYMECHFAPYHDEDSEIGAIGNKGEAIAYPAKNEVIFKKRKPKERHKIELSSNTGGHGGADLLILKDYLKCIQNECQPASDAVAGWDSAVVGRLAQLSAENEGKLFNINPYNYEIINK